MRLGFVEDSDEDWAVLVRLLGRVAPDAQLERVLDPEDLVERVDDEPALTAVLLDLNLTATSGTSVVRRLRDRGVLLPLVVLSGSDREADVDAAYAAGANAYVHKPLQTAELQAALATVVAWLRLVQLPGARRTAKGTWA